MIDKIEQYFEHFDFDIRKTHNTRFLDQKVTPDVLSIVADCVLNHVGIRGRQIYFTIKNREILEYISLSHKIKGEKL